MSRIPDPIAQITQRLQHRPSRWKRWLATGAGALVIVTSFFLGLVILLLAVAAAMAVAVFVGIRVWWLRRQSRSNGSTSKHQQSTRQTQHQQPSDNSGGYIIEGESKDITDRHSND